MNKHKLLLIIAVLTLIAVGAVVMIMYNSTGIDVTKLGYSVSPAVSTSSGITEADIYKNGISRNLLSGKVITFSVPPAEKRDKGFYNSVFNTLKQSGFITGNSFKVKRPYPNVFYVYNTSHNSDKSNYIVILTAVNEKTLKETVYLFRVSPVFMQEAVNKTTKQLVTKEAIR